METLTRQIDTIVGPVVIQASTSGLRRVELPGTGQLRLDVLWTQLNLPHTVPEAHHHLNDFGISLSIVSHNELGPYGRGAVECKSPADMVEHASDLVDRFFLGRLSVDELRFNLPMDLSSFSGFRMGIMKAMRAIPPGAVTTYGSLANAAGNPRAPRGAGAIVGANPLGLLVPCHRVVGAGGKLTGYGDGLPLKVAMLALEMRMAAF